MSDTLLIHGAAGRMGRRLIALASEDPGWRLAAAVDSPNAATIGEDAGTIAGIGPLAVPLSDRLPRIPPPAVVIDFSLPGALGGVLETAVQFGYALVIGTTGLDEAQHAEIDRAASRIPVLQAPNMSVGVNVMIEAVSRLARQLGPEFDIEVIEAHHRFKQDAPSGTAEALANALCRAIQADPATTLVHGRHGVAPRRKGEIGVHAVRGGDIAGKHTVSFATLGEELQVIHQASNRDLFARGALLAARWLIRKPAGRYAMAQVLGLDSA
ncbi:MAG: 4-hydroxy-tetrahydrodipicolinate reductase [Phycisphaeraceae bacterium]|nr:4-hydroxy-tetrahydrodipicolinate reductase [Phycisphaeraceae bacterium]